MKNRMQRIYMDYASATPLDARVKVHMQKVENKLFANPDALHAEGRMAKQTLEDARKSIAMLLRARNEEVIFTSGATEANNLALLGVFNKALSVFKKKLHIITSTIEHKSVLEAVKHLESMGADVTYVKPNVDGIISPKDIRDAFRKETVLVSIMYANNEIGTIQLITDIAKEIRRFKKALSTKPQARSYPIFHTDATQAVNYLDMNVLKLGVDMLTMNSPKIYGPVGIGALFVKRPTPLAPIIFGGGQEDGMRSGRVSPLLASGFAKAFEIAEKEKQKEAARLIKLRDCFFKKITELDKDISINGDVTQRLPNNVNICIPNIEAEFAVYQLDEMGIACSSASTCVNLSDDSLSYVVKEIKPETSCAKTSLRFSFGRYTTKQEVGDCLIALSDVVLKQRKWNTSLGSKQY